MSRWSMNTVNGLSTKTDTKYAFSVGVVKLSTRHFINFGRNFIRPLLDKKR